jgi:ATP adenylyltransferase
MKILWAPWRINYVEARKPEGCIFCEKSAVSEDEENLILHRGSHGFIIMNAFPYNNGHILVAPYRHVATLADLTDDEKLQMMQLAELAVDVISHVMCPDGFNAGINMGKTAGAGIADHIHLHVVPRWNGDTNFMPVVADTKVLPEALASTYRKLKQEFDRRQS